MAACFPAILLTMPWWQPVFLGLIMGTMDGKRPRFRMTMKSEYQTGGFHSTFTYISRVFHFAWYGTYRIVS